MEAGVAVFSAKGYNGCSVQDITETAAVPKGSFYNHFDSKEELAAAALDHFWEDKSTRFLSILGDEGTPPLERLRSYFKHSATELEALNYTGGCFVGNMAAEMTDHSPVVAQRLGAIYTCWTGRVAHCIAEARDAGTLRPETDPAVLATFVLKCLARRRAAGTGGKEQPSPAAVHRDAVHPSPSLIPPFCRRLR